ncbi:MAG: cupredoxin domain-containing protein [Nitrosotalea sp.]
MDLRHYVVFLISVTLLLSSQVVFADSSDISWKITIKKNGTDANSTVFWPPELQARQGDTIMWINNDTTAHTITSGLTNHLNYSGKVFDSGILNPGQIYSFKIPSGAWSAYYYFCSIHPWMTGKIDVGVAYLGKSPVFTIITDKESYFNNDTIRISGIVNDTSQIMPLVIQIFDSQRNMVFSDKTNLLVDHSFTYELKATKSIFETTGNYKIKAFYGFPATVTDVNFFFNNQSQDIVDASSNVIKIPYWVKNNAKWWLQNQISDKDFVEGIKFLATSGDLKTNISNQTLTKTNTIPLWIRNDASLWTSGTISDSEFISSIQYLITHNIIKT